MPLLFDFLLFLSPLPCPSLPTTAKQLSLLSPPQKISNPTTSKLPTLTITTTPPLQNQHPTPPTPLTICFPSLSWATVYYCKSSFNFQLLVEEDEPEEALIRRFRVESRKTGVIQECRRRKFFENPHDKKKRKAREASRKNRRWRFQPKEAKGDKDRKKEEEEDDDDNWELPEGEIPY